MSLIEAPQKNNLKNSNVGAYTQHNVEIRVAHSTIHSWEEETIILAIKNRPEQYKEIISKGMEVPLHFSSSQIKTPVYSKKTSKQSSSEEQNSEVRKNSIKAQIEKEERLEDERMIEEYKNDNTKDNLLKRMSTLKRSIIFTFAF